MADFVAVLRKTIGGLKDNSPEMREKVYDKARATIETKLAALDPPPPQAVADRQRDALEEAIAVVRRDYDAPPILDEDDDFADIFAGEAYRNDAPESAGVEEPSPAPGDWQDEEPVPAAPADETAQWAGDDRLDDAVYGEAHAPDEAGQAADLGDHPSFEDHPGGVPHEEAQPSEAQSAQDDGEQDTWQELPPSPYDEAAMAAADRRRPKGRNRAMGALVALLVLLVVGGAVYGIWANRSDLAAMFGSDDGSGTVVSQPLATPADEAEEQAALEPAEDEAGAEAPDEGAVPEGFEAEEQETPLPESTKFTQRLLPDGSEIDEGPAGGPPSVGEGSSVSAASASDEPAISQRAPGTEAGDDEQLAVAQRAIFYEEQTDNAEGSAETGTIVWSLVNESPGGDAPAEPAIRAEATIPGRDLQLRMTIRRNTDQSLPASHIIEMIFLTPDNFTGGTIDNVLRVAMKETEAAPGTPLVGIPAKIADGFFLVALSDAPAEVEANRRLMNTADWIDIPIVYGSGRRALMTLEKGIPGTRVFEEALAGWEEARPAPQTPTAGAPQDTDEAQ